MFQPPQGEYGPSYSSYTPVPYGHQVHDARVSLSQMMMNGQKYPMTLAEGVQQSYPQPPRYIQETDPIPGGIEQFRAMNALRGTPNPDYSPIAPANAGNPVPDPSYRGGYSPMRAFGVTQY